MLDLLPFEVHRTHDFHFVRWLVVSMWFAFEDSLPKRSIGEGIGEREMLCRRLGFRLDGIAKAVCKKTRGRRSFHEQRRLFFPCGRLSLPLRFSCSVAQGRSWSSVPTLPKPNASMLGFSS